METCRRAGNGAGARRLCCNVRKIEVGETDMCRLLATQAPQRFEQVSRSLRIAGHSTSIRLESAFWNVLDEIASVEGLSTSKLISALHDEAVEIHDGVSNLASMLRTVCLLHQREQARSASGRRARA